MLENWYVIVVWIKEKFLIGYERYRVLFINESVCKLIVKNSLESR